ncbi:MAG: hypothetical protein JWQ81_6143 [Amycolatopsis sp.]|uniref:helix-turn-helix domain-containing protein n=1 Tax=Amycolatopsis sp. TaxID=37632 RepID=UPI0026212270|nr:hypothetical protein [Amycolatopsis sp.]MCU1685404.1 hypothetical protein [Amycolatopsis sp.]
MSAPDTTHKVGNPQVTRPPLVNSAARRALAIKLKAAYEAGATTTSLAAEHGLAMHTIWRLLKEVDTAMRRTGPARRERDYGDDL